MLKKILFKKISSKGLAIFRVAYHLIFCLEIVTIFNFRHLYFDSIPYLRPHNPDITLVLLLWLCINICQIIGYRSKIFSVINYIFTIVFISSATNFEYHMFYTYVGVNFITMFLPLSRSLSIDFLLKKRQLALSGIDYTAPKVAKINYYIPILIGIALIYIDSALAFKLKSKMWTSGLGLWLPASVPPVTISENQWILNQEFLVKTISYIVFLFEFLFIFLFWFKRFRIPLFIIGVGFHLSIYFFYPIPYFALGYVSIYLLILPVSLWEKLYTKIENSPIINLISGPLKQNIKHKKNPVEQIHNSSLSLWGDKFRNYFLFAFCSLSILLQLQVHYSIFDSKQQAYKFNFWVTKYFGIAEHGVFIDDHFNGYDTIYTLKYKDEFLPLFDEKGMPGKYCKGSVWADWGFRVNKTYSQPNDPILKKGLVNYTAFWAIKNNLNLNTLHRFQIVRKKIKISFQWEKDLLTQNINSPWEDAGVLIWENYTPILVWK